MKKVYLCFALVAIALFTMTACGGGNGSKNGQNADEGEGQEIPTKVMFPIKVMGVNESETSWCKYRNTYTYELREDGMYSHENKREWASLQAPDEWNMAEGYPKHYEGRWTIRYRTAGETSQKVYEIHRSEYGAWKAHSEYLPDDLEYIWIPTQIVGDAWEQCENFDTRQALKLQSLSDI